MKIRKHFYFKGHDVFLIPSTEGNYLLYAPTLRKLLKITHELALRISESETECSNITRDEPVSVLALLLEQSLKNAIDPFPLRQEKSKFFHLALGLTKDCTLNCRYCHANAGEKEDMPQEVLLAAVRHAFKTAKQNKLCGVNVSFAVGGEPTARWDLFTLCIETINQSQNQYGIPAYLSMTTNGFYGPLKRRYIAEYFDSVLLSLDGPPEIQNFHRPPITGGGSYSFVRDSALFFLRTAKSFSIRATVSNLSVKQMPQIVEFFFREFGNDYHLVFEPLVPLGRAAANSSLVSEPTQKEFTKYYIQSRELGKRLGLEVRTSAANVGRLVTSFCGAMSIPAFTVTTRGLVTTCERDSDGHYYSYGEFSPASQMLVTDEHRVERNKTYLGIPSKCVPCFCKWHCAGDCPDLRNIGYDRCYVNRSLVKHELECLLHGARSG